MKKIRGIFEKEPGSGIWWVLWYDSEGKRHREKVGNKSSALDLYQDRKSEARKGKKFPANIRSEGAKFDEIADDALAYSKAHKRDCYNDVIRMPRLKAEFGNRHADGISHAEIDVFLESISKSPATFNRWRALVSMIYREGIRNGKVAKNPAKLVRPRRVTNIKTRFLTAKEENLLAKDIREHFPHHAAAFIVALNTGMRRSEQFSLDWAQIDLSRKQIHLTQTKNGSERFIPLNKLALSALKSLVPAKKPKPSAGPVFLTSNGEGLKNARTWFDDVVGRSGLSDVTWHTLRHTFASRLVMAGVDIRTVQELMGHKTLQMTVRYSHLAPSHTLSAVERLTSIKRQQPPQQPPRKKAAPKRAA